MNYLASPQDQTVAFTISRQRNGCWRVESADALTSGVFFDRDAALRFARDEIAIRDEHPAPAGAARSKLA